MIFHETPCAVPVHEMIAVRVVPVHKVGSGTLEINNSNFTEFDLDNVNQI